MAGKLLPDYLAQSPGSLTMNYVYKFQDNICQAPNCPFETGDLDCSGLIKAIDVVYLVNYVYKQQNDICDGCNP